MNYNGNYDHKNKDTNSSNNNTNNNYHRNNYNRNNNNKKKIKIINNKTVTHTFKNLFQNLSQNILKLTENCSAISVIILGGINSNVFVPPPLLTSPLDSMSSSDDWNIRRNSL